MFHNAMNLFCVRFRYERRIVRFFFFSWTLAAFKTKAPRSFEKLGNAIPATQLRIPEDVISELHRRFCVLN
jgi:hypothetical protein